MKEYSTDGKVRHLFTEDDIDTKISKIIGKKFVEYRKKWNEANEMSLVTDFPMFLHLDMNQECNYKCPHCIIGTPTEVKENYFGKNIDFNDYKRIVDEGADYGCPSISPQGNNEPFMIKDLEKYIQYAYKKGFIDIMLNNNGSALPKKKAQKILDSGLTRIRFSLDAFNADTYSKVRVGSIKFDRVKKNILDFLELREKGGYKLPIVGVSFCKMSHNEHELNEFIDYWKDKVDIVSIQKFMPPTDNKKKYAKYYSTDQYSEIPIDSFSCPQPYQRIVFRNEFMYPCCVSFNKDLSLGSIHEMSIYDAWHSDEMNNLREIHKNGDYSSNETCNKCVNLIYPEVN